jgi:hypothetical protein
VNWLKTANVIVLVIFTSYFGYSLIVPIYVKNTWEGEYKELMYGCDHAMKEHYIAKKAIEATPNDQTIKNLHATELSLMSCHDYDKLRKKMMSAGISAEELSMIGLETMEEKSYDLKHFVEIHEIRF